MPTTAAIDEAAAFELARQRPRRPPRLPAADLRTRVRTSPALRLAVPRRAALARSAQIAEQRWRSRRDRSEALAGTEAIVAGTYRETELAELAHRRLHEEEAWEALFWGPWRTAGLETGSAEAIGLARSSGRPVLISICHLGPYFLALSPLRSLGVSPIAVFGTWLFERPTAGLWGRRIARWKQGLHRQRVRTMPAPGSFAVICGLLEAGEVVASWFDMPGGTRTQFLGKPVELASGTSRLAHATGALVLPLRAKREGTRVLTEAWQPLDPRDHGGPEELHRAIAAVHERSILEMPEAMEDPLRPGAWEDGAAPTEWVRPNAGYA